MKYEIKPDRATIVVGGSLGLVLLLALYVVLHFWLMRLDFVREIDSIQPRTARLLGIVESAEKFEASSAAAGATLRELAYLPERDSGSAAADMQKNVREVMTNAGLSISASQILPVSQLDGFDRLTLGITVEGNIESLDDALSNLDILTPLVFIESIKVTSSRSRSRRRSGRGNASDAENGDPRKVTARFQLFSLRPRD